MDKLKTSKNQRRSIAFFIFIVIIAITFESFQQLYYIKRFDIVENVKFGEIFRFQALSWLVWLAFTPLLSKVAHKISFSSLFTLKEFITYFTTIVSMVIMCILTIAFIRLWISSESISFSLYLSDFLPYFFYQKAPIYTLGFISIAFVFHLNYQNNNLKFKIQELSELKEINEKAYNDLRSSLPDKSQILNIKIGNRYMIVPVTEICWIESDDYCVKIHTIKNKSYTMRSSLKALEKQLTGNFMRVHRTAIVNLDYTKEVSYSIRPNLTLQNDSVVPIAKSKIRDLKSILS